MKVFISILSLSVVAAVIWLFNTIFIALSNAVISFFMSGLIVMIILVAGAVITWVMVVDDRNVLGVIGVTLFLGLCVAWPIQHHSNHVALYNASNPTHNEDADSLSFGERVPYDVAVAVSDRSLGNTNGNANGIVKSVPKDNQYSTLVVKRGIFQGYESVQMMTLPEYGSFSFSSDIQFCKFDENAQYRFGGAGFNNNINSKAYWVAAQGFNPFIKIEESDAFAVCDGDTPKLYMPATALKFEGLITYRVPAGVVIYDGHTNEFTYEEEVSINGFPVYPQSVAEAQRESTVYSDGWWNMIMKKAGYETTGDTDEEDTNASNSTEFTLQNLGGKQTDYVTPLTPRGSSSSVIGLSTVEASTVKRGQLNPLNINLYSQPRQAPSTVASDIISSVLSGYKANGLTVFEVVPSEDGNWTATIGKNQSILYRAVINPDGDTTLYDDNGDRVAAQKSGDEEGEESSISLSGKPLEDMSVDELKQLMNELTAELADRASE